MPSIEFSIGTKAASTSRWFAASSASAIVAIGTSSAPASVGIDKSASSLKVPSGPRNAIRCQVCASAVHAGRIVMPMDELELRGLIDDLRSGACSPDDAVRRLRRLPFAELGFAKVDHHRALRQGLPEAVYGPGKTPAQCAAIVAELLDG